jgi:hypothetical protein
MLVRAAAAFLLVFGLVIGLMSVAAFAGEKELQQCTLSLQEEKIHASVVGQTRDAVERELAKALRANQELGSEYDKLALHVRELSKQLDELKAKDEPKEEPKAEEKAEKKPAKKFKPAAEKDPGVK